MRRRFCFIAVAAVVLQLVVVLLALLASVKGYSCGCCGCCDCCSGGSCCDCCCCGCSRGSSNNNAAATNAATATGLAIGSALLTNAAQPAIAPIDAAAEGRSLGPDLFPDGTTGRRNEQQLFEAIERANNAGGAFFPGRRRRRRRAHGFGRMDAMNTMFPGAGGGQNQQNAFGNEPPGLGPGLLPDGSTGRKSQHGGGGGFNNDFFDGMNFDGMHSPTAQQRQKKCHQKLAKRHCGQCQHSNCLCHQQNCQSVVENCHKPMKLLEIDPNLFQNYTVARFLLGLMPKKFVESKAKKSGGTFPEKDNADNSSPDNSSQDNLSPSAEIDITSASSPDYHSSSATDQRFQPVSDVADADQKSEDLIVRRLFLIPPVGSISGRMRRTTMPPHGAVPPPPLQFYKPIMPNPENADERLGVDDYD